MNPKGDVTMSKNFRRTRGAASVLLAGLASGAAVLLVTGGIASGSASSAQYVYGHPAPLAQPEVSGNPQVGQTLSTSDGKWQSDSKLSYQYRWGRCDSKGNSCQEIAGASSSKYTLTNDDSGHTIRSYVWATNSKGSTENYSDPTKVIGSTVGTTPGGVGVVDAKNVALPNRLVIGKQQYSQSPIRSRNGPTQMKVQVLDSNNHAVANALVFVEGIPYSRIAPMPEVRTDSNGWATVNIQPAKLFPRTGYLVLFVRARVEGQDLLGGTSTRRLVQVTIGTPNGT
jgi:hypothetical protein